MGSLAVIHGAVGAAFLALMIFLGEAGLPLPLIPGDVVLVLGGAGLADSRLDAWLYLPMILAAVVGGALCGYAATRRLGSRALTPLARRLGLDRQLDRAAHGLRRRGARAVLIGRLLPGVRVLTTLVSGALRLPVRTLLSGVIPSALAWIAAMTALGALIGTRLEDQLAEIDGASLAVVGVLLAVLLVALPARRALRRRGVAGGGDVLAPTAG